MEEAATGKKKRGRKPKEVVPVPVEEAGANTTDPDSWIMKTRQSYVQGYNVQAVVPGSDCGSSGSDPGS